MINASWRHTTQTGIDKLRPGLNNSLLPLENATSRLRSQPQTVNAIGCKQLPSSLLATLYVSSFLSGDSVMLSHWLQHYIDGLGVEWNRLTFFLHIGSATAAKRARTLAALQGRSPDMRQQVVEVLDEPYTDVLKLITINRWLRTLPMDAWAIYADSDEFFSFPCEFGGAERHPPAVPWHLQRSKFPPFVFCASMADRLAVDGTIAALQPTPDISVQYPFECHLRQRLSSNERAGRFMTSKTVLFKVYPDASSVARQFRNPHSLVNGSAAHCQPMGMYAHYTLTREAMDGVRRKYRVQLREAARLNGSQPNTTWVHVAENYIGMAPADVSIVCSLHHAPHQPCPDYKLLLLFMENQDREPSRDVSQICDVPHHQACFVRGCANPNGARAAPNGFSPAPWMVKASPSQTGREPFDKSVQETVNEDLGDGKPLPSTDVMKPSLRATTT